MPERIQRKRTKGWRMPPNTVCVTRPGFWGNPFSAKWLHAGFVAGGHPESLEACKTRAFHLFRCWLTEDCSWWASQEQQELKTEFLKRLPELRGKNLACFCGPDKLCHADILLELANK